MYCQRCGAEFHENTPKCPNCGTEYTIKNTTAPVEDKKAVPKISVFTKKKIIMTLLIAVILIAGGITAAVILSEGSFVSVSTFDMLQLADRYLKEMNYEQAIVEFRKILEIEPKNVDAYIGLAEAYAALGDNDKAIEVLKEAQRNVDNNQRIEDKLAEINGGSEPKPETVEPFTEPSAVTAAQITTEPIIVTTALETMSQTTTTVETTVQTTAVVIETTAPPQDTEQTAAPAPVLETTVVIAGREYSIADTTELSIKETTLSNDDLVNIGKLTNLTNLVLVDNQIADVSSLEGLTNLTTLILYVNPITDISPLARLTNLTNLGLAGNQITDITPLAGLTNLTTLHLNDNQIVDISPLVGLTNLTYLCLRWNQITNISPLAGHINLTELDFYHNQITDISPLVSLTNLTVLYYGDNPISQTQIQQLNAQLPNCYISDTYY